MPGSFKSRTLLHTPTSCRWKPKSDADNVFKRRMHLPAKNAPSPRRRLVPGGMYHLRTHAPPLAAPRAPRTAGARSSQTAGKGTEGGSRGPSARASHQLPPRRVKLRGQRTLGWQSAERARQRRGRWGGAHAGAGASPVRGGGRAGGDSCLMVPSARLLRAALGCLPPADRLPACQALGL